MTSALGNCCTRLGGSVTFLGLAACWIPTFVAVRTGSMGRSPGCKDDGGGNVYHGSGLML